MTDIVREYGASTQCAFDCEIAGAAEGPDVSDAQRSVDALVADALRYRSSAAYSELLRCVGRFRTHSPFNAMLIHLQMPGARFVAPAHRWRESHGRRIGPGERPLVILQPFGPVKFVYDVAQTERESNAKPLPSRVENPFAMPPLRGVSEVLDLTVKNAKPDGVRVSVVRSGAQQAGCISTMRGGLVQEVLVGAPTQRVEVPVRYEVEVSRSFSPTERYATLAHELGHLREGWQLVWGART